MGTKDIFSLIFSIYDADNDGFIGSNDMIELL